MHGSTMPSSEDHPPVRRQPGRSCRSKTAANGFYQDLDPYKEPSEEADPVHPGTNKGLNAGKGLHASQNPDRTQVQPASALGAREPDSQTVANDNLRDRSLSFSHRTPVQPVPAVNVGKSLKHDSDYEEDDDDTSHDDFDDDFDDDLGSLHNLKAPSLRVPQLRSRTNSNFDPQNRAVNLPNRASIQPVPALDARKPHSTGSLNHDPPTPLTDAPHWAQVQPVPAVGVGRSFEDMDVDLDSEEEAEPIDDFELPFENVEPPKAPENGRRSWTSRIQLVSIFASKVPQMVTLMRCLREAEGPEEIQRFLQVPQWCPPGCGWIYPLISQFEANRNQSAVLLVLHCPKHHIRLNPSQPDHSCFTDFFIASIVSYFNKHGIKCIAMDFRKECRRNHDGNRCPDLSKAELDICSIATMAEVHIARNVYGIKFFATIAISSNSCKAIACLQENIEFKPLLGTIYTVRWHPSALLILAFQNLCHELQYILTKEMINRDYLPVVQAIFEQFGVSLTSNLWDYLALSCVACDTAGYANIFVLPVDMDAVTPSIKAMNFENISNFIEFDRVRADNILAQRQVAKFFPLERRRRRMAVRLLQRLQQLFPDIDFGWVHEARIDPTTAGFSPPVLGDGRS